MFRVLVRRADHFQGLNRRAGLLVLRPDYLAFLPTGETVNTAVSLGLTLVGVDTPEGRPTEYDRP